MNGLGTLFCLVSGYSQLEGGVSPLFPYGGPNYDDDVLDCICLMGQFSLEEV